ncbi:Na+/H+ antiporter NhaA [Caulobacter segnis]|uniref:Na+/H+ antiporter NhaA n=1 Tax=Caulobacter segnis TaxID=88688 RepID=UPI001CBC3A97|nr:Na+/H+ antiporter NhaA [Caulobacter segnis]UAL10037.1 Na+/H+ antiporter NhaA [Caulobacter segnis]
MALKAISLRARRALADFLRNEAAGGYVLMAAAALALIVANSPLAETYVHALHTPIGPMGAQHWINDGLMALFFLLVGLEIKREVLDGQLSRPADVLLPGAAALGGVALPAVIYLAFNAGHPDSVAGWAIPSATDIAFALGVLALLGPRVPTGLKVFLTAIAIMDDLAAIVIIALFYTAQLHLLALAGAGVVLLALVALNRLKVLSLWPYLLLGAVLWVLVLKSGIHATLAGVALALTIPLREGGHSPLHRLEHALHGPVAFGVTPLFGFANAGLSFAGVGLSALLAPAPLGVALGLFLGKQLGVFAVAFGLIKLGWARLPRGASFAQLYGVAVLCGVGFTMSLFIGALAFKDPRLIDQTKIGVLAGSLASALVGMAILRLARPSTLETFEP